MLHHYRWIVGKAFKPFPVLESKVKQTDVFVCFFLIKSEIISVICSLWSPLLPVLLKPVFLPVCKNRGYLRILDSRASVRQLRASPSLVIEILNIYWKQQKLAAFWSNRFAYIFCQNSLVTNQVLSKVYFTHMCRSSAEFPPSEGQYDLSPCPS